MRATLRSISRGGAAHDDVGGLDVEVHHALAPPGSAARRRRAAPSGSSCSSASGPSRASSSSSVGPVEVLEHEVREPAVGDRAEAAHDDGVGEPLRAARPRGAGRAARPGRAPGRAAGPWRPAPRAGARPRRASPRSGARRRSGAARCGPGRARRPRRAPTWAAAGGPPPSGGGRRPSCHSVESIAVENFELGERPTRVRRVTTSDASGGADGEHDRGGDRGHEHARERALVGSASSSASARKAWASGGDHRRGGAVGVAGVSSPPAPLGNPVYGKSTGLDVVASAHPAILRLPIMVDEGRPRRARRVRRRGRADAARGALRAAHRRGRRDARSIGLAKRRARRCSAAWRSSAARSSRACSSCPTTSAPRASSPRAALITIVGALDDVYDLAPGVKLAGQVAAARRARHAPACSVDTFTFPFLHRVELGDLGGAADRARARRADERRQLLRRRRRAGRRRVRDLRGRVLDHRLRPRPQHRRASWPRSRAGAALGFLRLQLPPRVKVFMGDCGSNLLGLLLGAVIVEGTLKTNALIALVGPLVVLAVPFLDTGFVVAKRLKYRRRRLPRRLQPLPPPLPPHRVLAAADRALPLRVDDHDGRDRGRAALHPLLGALGRARTRAGRVLMGALLRRRRRRQRRTSSTCSRSSSCGACARGRCAAPTRTRPSTRSTSRSSASSRPASSRPSGAREPVSDVGTPGYGRSAAPVATRGLADNPTIGFTHVRRLASTARPSRAPPPILKRTLPGFESPTVSRTCGAAGSACILPRPIDRRATRKGGEQDRCRALATRTIGQCPSWTPACSGVRSCSRGRSPLGRGQPS